MSADSATDTSLRSRVLAALTRARHIGWDAFVRGQPEYLDDFWDRADVEIDGDPVARQALTGTGYNGHTFWDIDGFVVPLLALTVPRAAGDILRWRASTLPRARRRAETLGLRGAVSPWRTLNGDETSAYWPASTAALHLNADIARGFELYRLTTGDVELERECGLEVLVETARMWASAGHYDQDGRWHLDGVTGPDEYMAVVNDNVFTTCWRLATSGGPPRHAIVTRPRRQARGVGLRRLLERPPDGAGDLRPALPPPGRQAGRPGAGHAVVPRVLHQRGEGPQPRLLRTANRAGLLAVGGEPGRSVRRGGAPGAGPRLPARGGPGGPPRPARQRGQRLHVASLASAWSAIVEGFSGFRLVGEIPRLAPALPRGVTRLRFRLSWRGTRLTVDVTPEQVRCTLPGQPGARLVLRLYDEEVELTGAAPVSRPVRVPTPLLPEPEQPPGHQPLVRGRAT